MSCRTKPSSAEALLASSVRWYVMKAQREWGNIRMRETVPNCSNKLRNSVSVTAGSTLPIQMQGDASFSCGDTHGASASSAQMGQQACEAIGVTFTSCSSGAISGRIRLTGRAMKPGSACSYEKDCERERNSAFEGWFCKGTLPSAISTRGAGSRATRPRARMGWSMSLSGVF